MLLSLKLFAQTDFPPPTILQKIEAHRTTGYIKLDGVLDEPDWQNAPVLRGFKQVEPRQGEPAYFDTEVRILFDNKNLYIGIFAKDTIGKAGLRTNDLTRDFSFDNNDLVGIQIDPYNTRRNAIVFQVTPYGNLRDQQSFDDNIFDLNWNALWDARTTVTAKGWYAEIAIPFNTLAYPAYKPTDSINWGINFVRIHRRSNEISAFPGYPRSFDTYRMTYVASLTGLQPPKQDLNLRVDPYVTIENDGLKTSQSDKSKTTVKEGGDIRWGNTSHSTVDLTFNTDFAEADADQDIINLTRYSIALPERRQFFLENAGLLTVGDPLNLMPYFSRDIGLNANGQPIPIIAGLKYTDRTSSRSIGVLYTLQNSDNITPVTQFGVFRYVKNYYKEDNFGVILTEKATSVSNNTVLGISGVNRIGNWRFNYLWSNSIDKGSKPDTSQAGTGSNLHVTYLTNNFLFESNHTLVSQQYIPGIGFVSQSNLLMSNTHFSFFPRPKWKPDYIRNFQPGFWVNLQQKASDLSLQGIDLSFFLVYLNFTDGSVFVIDPTVWRENLSVPFNLVNLNIGKGSYNFTNINLYYNSDLSKKISVAITAQAGGWY
ncbi:MAG TPA: carbohydrate binding family 9 domain-containing protein, partial [Mucilaginibacter sp.]|nr:carbohydrate binding family 9 domain-containing protein [Mucilaginibacter sp.]